ncbi:TadE/TadG family type IV pilus assembly protein [Methylobacterium sp. J-090]|uniref:TadE/TadG family type IV pilus assembly protein n=1 Tax=Methylobacterium sp. J-090 TaxID=2836666 RepID=UPI001FB960A2|nr:TadE/TadG family type IV pilus assembly protein [Methylobacterium sp. J-090]MCJ2080020.1 pilus assembly protein [Methylobacterium sp. J-090]
MDPSPPPPRRALTPGALVARFRRAREGATVVEFAILAFPFLALITGIIDMSMLFWASQTLDDALADASRTIQTGQFQSVNSGVADPALVLENLRKQLCQVNGAERWTLFKCTEVKLDVRVFASMATGATASPIDPSTRDWSTGFGTNYANAQASTIVVIQAAVKYPSLTLMFPMTPAFGDGSRLLQSVQVFRTEPF